MSFSLDGGKSDVSANELTANGINIVVRGAANSRFISIAGEMTIQFLPLLISAERDGYFEFETAIYRAMLTQNFEAINI